MSLLDCTQVYWNNRRHREWKRTITQLFCPCLIIVYYCKFEGQFCVLIFLKSCHKEILEQMPFKLCCNCHGNILRSGQFSAGMWKVLDKTTELTSKMLILGWRSFSTQLKFNLLAFSGEFPKGKGSKSLIKNNICDDFESHMDLWPSQIFLNNNFLLWFFPLPGLWQPCWRCVSGCFCSSPWFAASPPPLDNHPDCAGGAVTTWSHRRPPTSIRCRRSAPSSTWPSSKVPQPY